MKAAQIGGTPLVSVPKLDLQAALAAVDVDPSLTIQEQCYAKLRHCIMVGAIPPGTQLTMRGLADAFHMSPTPIREAVRRLSSEHAIEILGNRRMQIPTMTLQRFADLLALRETLESHAAARALPYVSDIAIAELRAIDARMDEKVTEDAVDELIVLNQHFHKGIYELNPYHAAMNCIESVWLQIGPSQRVAGDRIRDHYLVDHHKVILSALEKRNEALLVDALVKDIRAGAALIETSLGGGDRLLSSVA
ncbi:HTH-type transcriptional regulator McbR [Methyloligella halotolerans]|uniref:HTH-type transcriptional regulator McbR n=1 Tax=Methyloligella halotolerans TaxID=1177755 RepID=A0A1E2RX00_9HYPH|nr:GntR family transcriptional regulator [Methyloligella halotolerans]ODA66741.1 HTH-type transcriptional regulator McbR [Methyloligella halotolerans]